MPNHSNKPELMT